MNNKMKVFLRNSLGISKNKMIRQFSSIQNKNTKIQEEKVNEKTIQKDSAKIQKEYNELFEYAKNNLAYKCGNLENLPSKYGFFKRWRMENKINYNNLKHPIFLYAYRAFIDALANQDK